MFEHIRKNIAENGFAICDNIFSDAQIEQIAQAINSAQITGASSAFRQSTSLYAIRQFLKQVPQAQALLFTDKLNNLIPQIFGKNYFVTKSIYFDKPAQSNWFVAYHQDLTISVDQRIEISGFGPWTVKQDQFAVQPPLPILESGFTIRIHLDDTDENNGALKVIPKSHQKGIYRPETIDWNKESDTFCKVKKGGIMIMKPLLLHSSERTNNDNKRRVVHIEFNNTELPQPLNWSEKLTLFN